MRKQCGNKWQKSWYNPRAGYPMFRCVEGGSTLGWVAILLLSLVMGLIYIL